jgi:hypothetical protein
MSLPSGLIFFLDFVFSPNLGASGTLDSRFGNTANDSIYGTNRVGSQITGGVSLIGDLKEDLSGPRTVGARGYSYASPSGSSSVTSSAMILSSFSLTGATVAQKKSIVSLLPVTLVGLFVLTFHRLTLIPILTMTTSEPFLLALRT